jgi:uncharacterized protein (TIGR03083 family)
MEARAAVFPAEAAFRAEVERLGEVMSTLDEADLRRPTRCAPWSVHDLLAHVRTATGRLTVMLAEPPPPAADVDAAGYYRAERFLPAEDSERVRSAQDQAAAEGLAIITDYDRTWRAVVELVATQPPDRPVRTRHGDAMRLDEFLVTRVVELGLHGLDLADALGRAPWLTDPAAEVIERLLLGDARSAYGAYGWDRLTLIAKATGRAPLRPEERAKLDRRGVRRLALG